jgi:cobalt/nickel transport system permease protein
VSGSNRLGEIGLAGDPASPIHRLDPRAKVVGFVGITILAVSVPLEGWPVWAGCAAALAAIAASARVSPSAVWRRARVVLPLVVLAAAFLPFLRPGGEEWSLGPFTVSEQGLEIFLTVAVKATIGTVSAVLLGATTTFPDVLRALEALRVPRVFTLVSAFMYRYLFVIAAEVRRMRTALAARGYRPQTLFQAGAIGRVVTALFLRSYARGERVYLAMLARGYSGSMPQLTQLSFGRADVAFVAALALVLVPLRVLA